MYIISLSIYAQAVYIHKIFVCVIDKGIRGLHEQARTMRVHAFSEGAIARTTRREHPLFWLFALYDAATCPCPGGPWEGLLFPRSACR